MRVLILWADNQSANLGVRVLARGTAELVRGAYGADTQVDFQDFEAGDSQTAFNKSTFAQDIGRPHGPMKAKLEGYDLVVDTGAGDSFTDAYGWKRLLLMSHVREVLVRKNIPYVMSPQTIGPFTTAFGRLAGGRGLHKASVVVARDPISARHSLDLGRPAPSTSDVVFALPTAPRTVTSDVVLNVSGLLWQTERFGPSMSYRAMIQSLIETLIKRNVSVTLLAHVLANPTVDDDTDALADLQRIYGTDASYVVPRSLEEARETIAGAGIVVGSRMHACLNAISQGVPTLPIAYSRKFGPLFNDLGWNHGMSVADAIADPVMVTNLAMELRDQTDSARLAAANGRARIEQATRELAGARLAAT